MRRSICYSEPSQVLAGEVNSWKFIYTTAVDLPKGARLKFDLQSKGRWIDWQEPDVDLKKGQNVIYATIEGGKPLAAKSLPAAAGELPPSYEFTLPQPMAAEQSICIHLGALQPENEAEARTKGNRAQTWSQRRRTFALYVDLTGKGRYEEAELFTLDVRGNQLHQIRIAVPSVVVKNKRFDVAVRFEDEFGNLTANAPEETLIELNHEKLRDNLNWKLFIPETGYILLPNLYFNEAGVYTLTLKNSLTGELFAAPPIKCFASSQGELFWGLLHGESDRFDSTENIESCLRHFRDECGWSFVASSPFDSNEETSNELWRQICQNLADFDEADRFVTFYGSQWVGSSASEGIRQLLFAKEAKQLPRHSEAKYSSLAKLYQSFSPKELLSIPSFTMGKGHHYNFKSYHPQFERVVEIYNAWGSSERSAKEGNLRPIEIAGKKGIQESSEGSIQLALRKNCRFGFVGGGLDDRGIYSGLYEGDQVQYSPGATAIIAKEQSRATLFEALYNRSCYATTGPRIIVGLCVAGAPMGSEISSADRPGLIVNRHLTGYVVGTTLLEKVELLRNGEVLQEFAFGDYHGEFAIDDMTALDQVCLTAPDKKSQFVYYYLRIIQTDGHMAWSSPIWVDYETPRPRPPPKEVPKKVAFKPEVAEELLIAIDEEDEDEEDEELEDDEE